MEEEKDLLLRDASSTSDFIRDLYPKNIELRGQSGHRVVGQLLKTSKSSHERMKNILSPGRTPLTKSIKSLLRRVMTHQAAEYEVHTIHLANAIVSIGNHERFYRRVVCHLIW